MITSAHVMSAINKDDFFETDINQNPLRDLLFTQPIKISNGWIMLNDLPGIGFMLNNKYIKKYQVDYFSI